MAWLDFLFNNFVVQIIVGTILSLLVMHVAGILEERQKNINRLVAILIQGMFLTVGLLAVLIGIGRFWEGLPLNELGLRPISAQPFALLLLFTAVIIVAVFSLSLLFKTHEIEARNRFVWIDHARVFLGTLFYAAIFEEILFRGIWYRLLEVNLGTVVALLFSAFFFGIAHYFSGSNSLFASIVIGFTGGLGLGLIYTITRNLWFVIVAHLLWNYCNTICIEYDENKQTRDMTPLIKMKRRTDSWLSGGEGGIEASGIVMIVAIGFVSVLILLVVQGGYATPAPWQMG